MQYKMSGFIRRYFVEYCKEQLGAEAEEVDRSAQEVYDRLMHETPDMGENMMASNIDMVAAFFAYYEASGHRIDETAIEVLVNRLYEDYKWVSFFTDMNRWGYVKPLYYKIYADHAKKVEEHKARGEWTGTWTLKMNPDNKKTGIAYHMIGCPLYAFVKAHGYEEMMPYICRFDFIFEKFLHAKLLRKQTEATGGQYCDYWFVPDKSPIGIKYKDYKSK